ncbi:MAG: phosphoglycolate phosphatase [Pseudomonadota bacterium]|nr:phosphoglycolate phosphatase [Pseudomonadota bacterium]
MNDVHSPGARGGNWPRAVLFDLDGTLVHSAPDIATSLNLLGIEEGWRDFPLEEVQRMVGGGVPKLIERTLTAMGSPIAERDISILAERFVEIYATRATDKTRLYPGARELLDDLTVAGVRLGLCTNKPEAITRDILAALGVDHRFGAVVGGDSGFPKKPDPASMRATLGLLGIAPEHAVMIGDSGADAHAARAAGLALILVTYGYTQTPVIDLDADALIDGLAEVPAALRQLSRAAAS